MLNLNSTLSNFLANFISNNKLPLANEAEIENGVAYKKNKKKVKSWRAQTCNFIKKSFPIQVLFKKICTQPVFTFSKLTIKTLEQGVKYVQS